MTGDVVDGMREKGQGDLLLVNGCSVDGICNRKFALGSYSFSSCYCGFYHFAPSGFLLIPIVCPC